MSQTEILLGSSALILAHDGTPHTLSAAKGTAIGMIGTARKEFGGTILT